MDFPDKLRPGEAEEVVAPQEILGVGGKAEAPKIFLGEAIGLNHGAHGPVKDKDPFRGDFIEPFPSVHRGYGTIFAKFFL
jgi:hypothetical protein